MCGRLGRGGCWGGGGGRCLLGLLKEGERRKRSKRVVEGVLVLVLVLVEADMAMGLIVFALDLVA